MIRPHKIGSVRKTLLLNLAATSLVLFAAAATGSLTVVAQTRPTLPIPAGTPAALIKRIVVSNRQQSETSTSQGTVTRTGTSAPITTDLLLYKGDLIETFADTQVTVLFLDVPVPGRDNEVIIDANGRVGISSSDSWWGRTWAKVKDAFKSETRYARLSARGTEYDLTVCSDDPRSVICKGEGHAILVVLDGTVDVEEGKFNLTGKNAGLLPESRRLGNRYPQFLLAGFFPETPVQERFNRALDVPTGQITRLTTTYHLHNDCKLPHRIEFRTSDNTDWFRLAGDRIVEIAGGQNLSVDRTLVIDATRLTAGKYDAHVYAVCLDCNLEAGCPEQQLDYGYGITVSGPPPTPTPLVGPSPAVTPTNQHFTVNAREESAITRDFDQPAPAPTPSMLAVLAWTNQVILTTQPSYSSPNLIPHFSTTEQRSQSFRDARQRAILANEPGSNRVLGDIYSDWGQGAWAVKAYNKERESITGQPRPSATSSVDLAEAYRLTGQLTQARDLTVLSPDSSSAAAQNLLGNVYSDYARIALDRGDRIQAGVHLEQARTHYASALSAPQTTGPSGFGAANTTVKTNLAKTHIAQGDLILQTSPLTSSALQVSVTTTVTPQASAATQLAKTKYSSAVQLLADTQQADSTYPFGVTELGRAYQGLGDATMLEGNATAASEFFGRAKGQYNRVTGAHPDCAEAYFNLGDLSDDIGDKEAAKDYYRRAIKVRPEQPASYYPLALLLQKENPRLAAALAAAYLQLEAEVFKQGEKGRNAEMMVRGDYVTPPKRPGTPPETPIGVAVPNIVDQTQAEATNRIRNAGFILGKIENRSNNKPIGSVLEQRPAAGTNAPRGSTIDIVISSGFVVTEPIVPNVLNISQTDATTAIENAGLKVGKIELKSETKPKNTVVKQTPNAGKKVTAGSAVDLVVSAGKLVDVPNIVKESEQTARKKLADKGLTVGTVTQRPDCDLVGRVIEQNPSRIKVEIGTAVDFVIGSVGENPVTVPNFVGASRYEVEAAIRERRFILSKVGTEETDNAREGTVLKQSPQAGTQFAKDCPVKIEITVAIPLTTVGNYVGLSELEARQQLSGIGLSADVRYRESANDNPGIVLNQSPPPGSRVRRRSPVLLAVSVKPAPPIIVPQVVGMPLVNARNTLLQAGLRVGVITYNRPVAGNNTTYGIAQPHPCYVTNQDPVQGQQVRAGTPVNLWVNPLFDAKGGQLDCLNPPRDGIR